MTRVTTPTRPQKTARMAWCTVQTDSGAECRRPVPEDAPAAICTLHALMAAQWVAQTQPALVEKAIVADHAIRVVPRHAYFKVGKPSCVYYMRFGDLIKIGTTTDLPQRLTAIPHDALLAIEPGSNGRERARHAEFRSAHHHREWFKATPALLEHCAALRQKYGEPMTAWENVTRRAA